ncbi:MAG: hypothetical protein LBF41_06100 [Deltaproteobacteria bacterium]|jgi:hypothetical protein|nr:hypothetical protein [Deltaproteobacteria bacterium]
MNVLLDTYALRVLEYLKKFPDPRTGKNIMYPFAQLSMTALAAFYSRAPSLKRFLDNVEKYRGDKGVGILMSSLSFGKRGVKPKERVPTDNHIRKQLDGLDPEYLFEPILDILRGILSEAPADFSCLGRTVVFPYATKHYSSRKMRCSRCVSRSDASIRGKRSKVEHFHSYLGFSLVRAKDDKLAPQLPPEYVTPRDYPGYVPGEIYEPRDESDRGPAPELPTLLARCLDKRGFRFETANPLFALAGEMGTLEALSALKPTFPYLLVLNGEERERLRREIPPERLEAPDPRPGAEERPAGEHPGGERFFAGWENDPADLRDLAPDLREAGIADLKRPAYLLKELIPPENREEDIVLTDLSPTVLELRELLPVVEKVKKLNVPEKMRGAGYGPVKRFGHGNENLAEVFAGLNILSLNLFCLGEL